MCIKYIIYIYYILDILGFRLLVSCCVYRGLYFLVFSLFCVSVGLFLKTALVLQKTYGTVCTIYGNIGVLSDNDILCYALLYLLVI